LKIICVDGETTEYAEKKLLVFHLVDALRKYIARFERNQEPVNAG